MRRRTFPRKTRAQKFDDGFKAFESLLHLRLDQLEKTAQEIHALQDRREARQKAARKAVVA